ncbi:MAG: Holliday junction branch migration protein RuvA [Verrucomicrobiae bacterium]|nr:Holliday junction branch migration protein RuvA [Verrucomicrobiae bacterium]
MIDFLRGTLHHALPTQVSVEVGGVGYEVLIPVSSFDALPPPGHEVRLLTHLMVREDAHTLYGFATAPERELFRLLIGTVSGIGPRLALNILSGMAPTHFRAAVAQRDVRALSQISGVGKKTAERIVLELKDKVGQVAIPGAEAVIHPETAPDRLAHDAVLALVALGFKQAEAIETVRATQALLGPQANLEEVVRRSLKKGAA